MLTIIDLWILLSVDKENMKGKIVYTVFNNKKRKKYELEADLTLKASPVKDSVQVLNFQAGLK